jgi:hypothetical protein
MEADDYPDAYFCSACINVEVTGLPMPYRVDLVFPSGLRIELKGVVCREGETFLTAVAREARELGAVAEFLGRTTAWQ